MKRSLKQKINNISLSFLAPLIALIIGFPQAVLADAPSCGASDQSISTSIDLGCTHQGNPITDMLFAFIRLLSAGVGIVVIASIVVGGIQFSISRSNPQAAANAINRIRTSLIALLIYIFSYAILNFVIPGGFFHS